MAWMRTSAPGWPLVSSPPIFQRTGCPVEIGRLDEEQPTFRVFSRNPRKHIVVEIVGNGLVERSQIRQSSVGERSCGGQNVSYRRRDHQYHLRPIGDGRPGLIRES